MPIFEYKCSNCNSKFDVLHKSSTSKEEIICPECKSSKSEKLFSSFSASVNGSTSYSGSSCADGSCDVPSTGGCASGMCGLN